MSTTSPSFSPAPPPGAGWAAAPPHVPLPPPGTSAFPPAPAPPRTSGLAVVAVVLASLAMVGTVVSALWFGGSGIEGSSGDGYGSGPLTGQIDVDDGRVAGVDLAAAVRGHVESDGGHVGRMTCPDTAGVGQNVTTVCHGQVDDAEWAMVVFFEDTGGSFTILPV